ncbi:MAG TPA: restriction endonuclease subunit S [Candidatus Cloacimonadota bacterium]|nr:restriction endonuclease subunit S [Candidatus Cloacimonadota bacterium]
MGVKYGYKMTEVGVIPQDWSAKQLNGVCQLKSGSPITSAKISDFEQYPCYGGNGLRGYTNSYTHSGKFCLIGRQGALCGNINFVDDIFFASEHAIVVTPRNDFDIKWLSYVLSKMNLNQYSESSAQPGLSVNKVSILYIPTPPTKVEQTAIATALSDADALITSLEKLIAKKRCIKQGVMQQLLTPKEGWVKRRLGDSAEIFRGGSPRPIESYITANPDGINWIKIGDVSKSAKFIESTEEKIIKEGMSRSRYVKEGDFLLSNSMSFGRPYILKTNGCIHDGWLVIQNYQYHFDKEFLYYVLGSESIMIQYKAMASGSSVLNLNKEIVQNVVVNCPESVQEQNRISTILSDIDNDINTLEHKQSKQIFIKHALMQQLLTGKIRLVKS